MMAAVINLIRGLFGFGVCQSDICPSCHLNSIAVFDAGAPLTCSHSNVGSCGYLEGDYFFNTTNIVFMPALFCVDDENHSSQECPSAV